jgi:hypothetical protein
MKAKIAGQVRHFLTSGGWLLFLLVFLPKEWWERAIDNVKAIGTILGLAAAAFATYGHVWSARNASVRDGEATRGIARGEGEASDAVPSTGDILDGIRKESHDENKP